MNRRNNARPIARATVAGLAAAQAGPVIACVLCHSPQAQSLRARLFGPDLPWNAAVVALPLLLLLAIIALVAREPGGGGGQG